MEEKIHKIYIGMLYGCDMYIEVPDSSLKMLGENGWRNVLANYVKSQMKGAIHDYVEQQDLEKMKQKRRRLFPRFKFLHDD